jgi:hypothetical protein
MKKGLLILTISILICNNLLSENPIFFVGGDLGFSYSTTNFNQSNLQNNSNFLFNLNPNVGYYITNGLVLGFGLQFYNSNNNSPNSVIIGQKSSQVYFSPFLRYYSKSDVFGQVQLNVGMIHSETDYYENYVIQSIQQTSVSDITAVGLGLGFGYAIKAGENFKIEPFLKYNYVKYSYDKNNLIANTGGLTFNIGFSYSL